MKTPTRRCATRRSAISTSSRSLPRRARPSAACSTTRSTSTSRRRSRRPARKHQQQITIREIKFRPKIAQNDYDTKKGHVERFLKHKDKVKITIMFRGREVTHPERGAMLLERLAEELEELPIVEQRPIQDGRNMTMMLGPSKAVLSGQYDSSPGDGRRPGRRRPRRPRDGPRRPAKRAAERRARGSRAEAPPAPRPTRTGVAEPPSRRRRGDAADGGRGRGATAAEPRRRRPPSQPREPAERRLPTQPAGRQPRRRGAARRAPHAHAPPRPGTAGRSASPILLRPPCRR